ncbi:ATP-binding protein [Psychrobacillus sp. NEAU-3TGS]|uniref:hybrid sensor histidine kinase/response regulator n=1 Tax=Psychrobacillus sp. NEAU-3TGS TaxID=2995412 RepID=UPI0024987C9A|nr:ATP-binding protein [Psychrobacillus sp. NEAU-3TGS]MDI2587691.1 ATP-binding protein [Psychrobacillus sp. NEAU-3TGS]
MKKSYIKIITIIGLLLISAFALNSILVKEKTVSPKAVGGVLDLRNYEFDGAEPIEMNGEWEFVPNKLVDSTAFDKQQSYQVEVPSLWTNYDLDGQKLSKYTSGTYRLKILLNDSPEILGIKTTNIRMSNAIYIDGQLLGSSGIPAEDSTYIPHNIPYVSYFSPNDKELEMIVQVANFDYASGGGILGSIFIGDQDGIGNLRDRSLAYDWVTIAAFSTMFIYFLGTFLHARIGVEQLFFSLFCFANVLYAVSHGEKVFLELFPATSYAFFERIQSVSSIWIGLFMLCFFHSSLKQFANKRIVKFLYIVGVLLTGSALLPVKINSSLQIYYSLYIFISLVYIIYIQIIAISKRAVGASYLIFSSFTIFIYFTVGTLNVSANYAMNSLPPLFPFICLTMLSLYISHRFMDSFLQKEELSNALLRVDKLKDGVLAKASHEFRTPLHGIIAISQSMLEDRKSSLSTEEEEKMGLIVGTAQRLSKLVNDILDYSKLKEGELRVRITPVDLFALTHVVVETFTYMIDKDVKVINHVQRGQFVMADEERLRQILFNLIDNAVKYTMHGKIEIKCDEHEENLVITVSDTGIGIASENLKFVFEPFRQYSNATGGTGLGLSVTKELVQIQGGTITVNSVVNKGTNFSVTLPKATQLNKPTKQSFSLPIPSVNGNKDRKKIIIADDDHVNLKVLIDTLISEDYFIVAVDSGKAVLEQVKKHPDIDLVILDIMMPEVSGYEVCHQLRKSYLPSELPILMLTAAVRPEDMIAAFHSGANDFLHKPLDTAELKTRIRNLLLMKESSQNAVKMEVAFLQAQIKPHFIFNVLNSILSLSYIDLDRARTMITDFANFMRGSFSFENTHSLVPLEKELSLIQSYVNIQRTRFPERLVWEVQMEDPLHCFIPPLILQPIVENAIVHGLKMTEGQGIVKLTVIRENDFLVFQITDNGTGISTHKLQQIWNVQQDTGQSVGLQNIKKRLKYYENASIQITSKEHKGTIVELRFPFIQSEKEGE